MPDLFKQLPALYWRGVGPLPIANRQVSFEHDIIRHKFMYRDDELVESVGRKNWIFSYTLAFYEDISPGKHGYKNLYTKTFPEFLAACRNRDVGTLEDPMLGSYLVRCENFNVSTDVNRRDGESVEVRFIYSPNEAEIDEPLRDFSAVTQNAVNLDSDIRLTLAQLEKLGIKSQDIKTSLEAGKGSIDLLAFIAGAGNRAALYIDQIDAAFASYYSRITNVVDAYQRLAKRIPISRKPGEKIVFDPTYMPAIREAKRQIDAIRSVKGSVVLSAGKVVVTMKTKQDHTVSELAAEFGMTVTDFLALNSSIPKPMVPAGTWVRYVES